MPLDALALRFLTQYLHLKKKLKFPLVKETKVMIYYESLSGTRGSWRNWLAHWTVDPGVAGSSPVDPASTGK